MPVAAGVLGASTAYGYVTNLHGSLAWMAVVLLCVPLKEPETGWKYRIVNGQEAVAHADKASDGYSSG
jgi:hypothetical protein